MNRMILQSRVDPDGVLRLAVPIGAAEADQPVLLTIEPIESQPKAERTPQEWREWVLSTEGSVTDEDFRRHDQGEYEPREPLT